MIECHFYPFFEKKDDMGVLYLAVFNQWLMVCIYFLMMRFLFFNDVFLFLRYLFYLMMMRLI
ncbi:hypothetical protein BGL60_06555 [Helicobacter pylori]|nr:hypothetical protein BGL60_06570 [Helicobacter pylori]OPG19294.1 hypothetical protein BGL60_06555 [Helicobacter pylori]